MLINATKGGSRIALLDDKKLIEYHVEEADSGFRAGDVYLGTVVKINRGLNAVFVDIGHEKYGFLHYHDLGPGILTLNKFLRNALSGREVSARLDGLKYEPEIPKDGKIHQVLTGSQKILVQIVKEAISTKGPRLTSEINLTGRFMVLNPFATPVTISRKINDAKERNRLRILINTVKPKNFRVIVRTVAEGKMAHALVGDMNSLTQMWEEGVKQLGKAKQHDKIIGEMGRTNSILRDMLNSSFDSITVDNPELAMEIKSYIRSIAPEKEKIVKLHLSRKKIFEVHGVERQLRVSFGKNVSMPGGGYLVIEHTEALHVIDVNSGNRNLPGDQESNALEINLKATEEIARQLRLRDLGGIIVIDFIDLQNRENRQTLYSRMKEVMDSDRSRHTILHLTKFGLMQITRQRVRPEMNISTKERCPACLGSGTASPSILISDRITESVEKELKSRKKGPVKVIVHPFLWAYFTKGLFSYRFRWFWKFRVRVKVVPDSSFGLTDFVIMDRDGAEADEVKGVFPDLVKTSDDGHPPLPEDHSREENPHREDRAETLSR